ncbi:hypothetical protein A6R68_05890, partial [Neotoma lepida]
MYLMSAPQMAALKLTQFLNYLYAVSFCTYIQRFGRSVSIGFICLLRLHSSSYNHNFGLVNTNPFTSLLFPHFTHYSYKSLLHCIQILFSLDKEQISVNLTQ